MGERGSGACLGSLGLVLGSGRCFGLGAFGLIGCGSGRGTSAPYLLGLLGLGGGGGFLVGGYFGGGYGLAGGVRVGPGGCLSVIIEGHPSVGR